MKRRGRHSTAGPFAFPVIVVSTMMVVPTVMVVVRLPRRMELHH